MKTRVQIALMGCLLSVFAQVYLTLHYYPLKFGFSTGQSICNLNAKFDCDAVAASSYSSFLNIPLSVWGGALAAVMFVLILLGWLEWTSDPERTRRVAYWLTAINLGASVVMAGISAAFLHTYCPICIALYALSLVIFFAYQAVPRGPVLGRIGGDVPALFTEDRYSLGALVAIPVLAFLVHKSFMSNFGDDKLAIMVRQTIGDWQNAPKQDFVAKPTLTMGANGDAAALTLVEFADFRCGHCKHASYTLDAFVKAHPDVRLEFYSFPLDGACNEKIPQANGISCRLAQAVYCAAKDGQGWPLHHAIFDAQESINQMGTNQEIDALLAKEVAQAGLSWETVQRCVDAPSTLEAIKAQAKQGALVNIQGTPTVFANGRQLARAQIVPVLAAAREHALSAKK